MTARNMGRSFGFTTRLYFDSEEEQPIWLVDAEQGSRLDIAVLPLSRFNEHPELVGEADREDLIHLVQALIGHTAPQHISVVGRPTCFVAHKRPEFDARLEVADDVYVIGFPQAIAAGHGTAIWKRGSVASEPDLELQRRSAFLIDSATRPGLSGAPVVARFKNPSFDNAGRGRLTLLEERLGFCGLYSSRLGKDVEGAQLGVVWKVEAIERVITSGIAGRSSKDFGGLLTEGAGDSIV